MKRGDVYWISFTSAVGGEIQKRRPAVIVSNDAANRFLNRVQVVPLTTKVSKLFPSEALVTVKGKQQKAMADQLATVSKKRIGNKEDRARDHDSTRYRSAGNRGLTRRSRRPGLRSAPLGRGSSLRLVCFNTPSSAGSPELGRYASTDSDDTFTKF